MKGDSRWLEEFNTKSQAESSMNQCGRVKISEAQLTKGVCVFCVCDVSLTDL